MSYQNHLDYGLSLIWKFNFWHQCNISAHGRKHIKDSVFLTCIIIYFMVTLISSTIIKILTWLKTVGIFVKILLILITWYPFKKNTSKINKITT